MNEQLESEGFTREQKEKLDAFYVPFGATTTAQKIHSLETRLGHSNFYVTGGELTDEMKLGCLEYEFVNLP